MEIIISKTHLKIKWDYTIKLDEAQPGIKTARRNINNLRNAEDTTLMAESEEELKSLLMNVKEESEKTGLKLNIQKTKIMASSPITSWQINGETARDFLGSKITADGDCSHETKRCLLLGRKAITNLDSMLKSRDITLPTKICLVKAMVFTVVMYGCESWTIEKVECWRIDAFELWCWRRCLRVPWTTRRSNQSILKISPEYSLQELMLNQYFSHLMQRIDSLEKKDWRQEENGTTEDEMVGWHHWLDGHEFEQALEVGNGHGVLVCCGLWGRKDLDMTEGLNWTALIQYSI